MFPVSQILISYMNAHADLHQCCVQIMSSVVARFCHIKFYSYGFSFTKWSRTDSQKRICTNNELVITQFQADLLRYLHDL